MREIINISMPAMTVKEIKKEARDGGFASTSEFFRYLWRERQVQKLALELAGDRRRFNAGKGKVLRSLRDLR